MIDWSIADRYGRQTGKTTKLCQVVKELNGVLIVGNREQGKSVEAKFDVKWLPVHVDHLLGYPLDTPIIFDTSSIPHMIKMYRDRCNYLAGEVNKLRALIGG